MTVATLEEIVAAVPDPELRVISIGELGMVRGVEQDDGGRIIVTITPTYTGCPAMDAIRDDITAALTKAGHHDVEVRTRLDPAWSTDMISDSGREKLARSGIAPPGHTHDPGDPDCPGCGGSKVTQISRYGSTPCQALYSCQNCREPFPAVKTL